MGLAEYNKLKRQEEEAKRKSLEHKATEQFFREANSFQLTPQERRDIDLQQSQIDLNHLHIELLTVQQEANEIIKESTKRTATATWCIAVVMILTLAYYVVSYLLPQTIYVERPPSQQSK